MNTWGFGMGQINNQEKILFYYHFLMKFNFINSFLLKLNSLYLLIDENKKFFFLSLLKFNSFLKVTSLMDITVVDNYNLSKRFEVIYSFWSHLNSFRIFFKIHLFVDQPCLSIRSFYKSADWLEREVWDMFGIKFLLHNDLRRILTDYGFKGHPLRKDFPSIGYVEIIYDENHERIKYVPIESAQSSRSFSFINPWKNWK